MPRELVHWHIVDRVKFDPRLGPAAAAVLTRYTDQAMLGSFTHDVPYYFHAGHDAFEYVADYMHGTNGEDSFVPMKRLAAAILALPREERDPAWALFAGMLTHIAADAVFHPMIFYFTGNYHDSDPAERPRAQARHRLIEVYLESWMRPRFYPPHGPWISSLLRRIGDTEMQKLSALLDSVLLPGHIREGSSATTPKWWSGYRQLSTFQMLFGSPVMGGLIRLLNAAAFGKLDGIDALFNFGRTTSPAFFDGPLAYQNPISGEPRSTTSSELLAEAATHALEYIALAEPLMSGASSNPDEAFGGPMGPSLNFFISGSKAEDARFFSSTGVPLKGLVRSSR